MLWSDHLAARPGIQLACSIEHVEELVLHWMTTGRLDYPFSRSALGASGWRQISAPGRVDIQGERAIGELAVHRESLERALTENPESLRVILEALLEALRREIASDGRPVPSEAARKREKELCAVSPEPGF